MTRNELSDARWQRVRLSVLARDTHCHLCGRRIDRRYHWPHPLSPTVDHLTPRSHGGALFDPSNLAAAHKRCNEERGVGPAIDPLRYTSREW